MKRVVVILFVAVLVCGAFVAGVFLPKLVGGKTVSEPEPAQAAAPVLEPREVQVVEAAPVFVRAEAPQLRIVGGELQWFDGAQWRAYGDTDALLQADPVAAAILARLAALEAAYAEPAPTAPHLRAAGSVRRGGGGGTGGGGSSGGGGSGGSDGQDIEWSGDQL